VVESLGFSPDARVLTSIATTSGCHPRSTPELDGNFDHYQQVVRAVPAGLTEWAVHPAACEAGAGVRSSDLEFLVSPQAADTIRSEQIHVISYQPLRESWRQRGLSC
jgi:hypothetical protein